jgi:catechol 2,3-dioxygenase-like lactoylglutathione lyase family enzyme
LVPLSKLLIVPVEWCEIAGLGSNWMNGPKMHVSLNVRNLEASVRFYEVFFGVPAHKRRTDYANFDLAVPPLKLALQEIPGLEAGMPVAEDAPPVRNAGALSHMGIVLETKREVDAVRERLVTSGLATFDEGDTVCCYARQDKIWAHDPDGNGWEIYTVLDDHQEEPADKTLMEAVACCEGTSADTGPISLSLRRPLNWKSC